MRPPLDKTTRAWVAGHEAAMRKAAADAIAASNRWRQLNATLMEKWRAEGRDDLAISKDKAANLSLNDEYGTYAFFAGKAQMHAAVLQGALAARVLLADPDDDPMLYDRSEEEPVAAPTRPHDGFSITGRTTRPANSPAGFASTDGRARQVPSRPGVQLPEGFPASGTGQGTAVLRGAAVPARGGVR